MPGRITISSPIVLFVNGYPWCRLGNLHRFSHSAAYNDDSEKIISSSLDDDVMKLPILA